MSAPVIIGLVFLIIPFLLMFALYFSWTERGRRRALEKRFKGVIDAEAVVQSLGRQASELRQEIERIRADYATKRATYDQLAKEVAIFDEKLAFAEMGIYEPHFDFTDSEAYKDAVQDVREEQKQMVSLASAVICTTQWSVDGSAAKGKTLTNRNIRLTLRAFNNECDAAIANTRWNNVNSMEKRIIRAQEQIDKLNASNSIFITQEFLSLKLKELFLTHEYRERLKQEREERAEAARLAKEEQKLLRDMEKAQEEEDYYQKLLSKASG
jgi:uncharacterized protein YlaI